MQPDPAKETVSLATTTSQGGVGAQLLRTELRDGDQAESPVNMSTQKQAHREFQAIVYAVSFSEAVRRLNCQA